MIFYARIIIFSSNGSPLVLKTHVSGVKQGGFQGDKRRNGRFRPREKPGIYRETGQEYTEKPTGNLIKCPENRLKMPRKFIFRLGFRRFRGGFFGVFGLEMSFRSKKHPVRDLNLNFKQFLGDRSPETRSLGGLEGFVGPLCTTLLYFALQCGERGRQMVVLDRF